VANQDLALIILTEILFVNGDDLDLTLGQSLLILFTRQAYWHFRK